MLEMLPSSEDVIAVRVSGRLEQWEIEAMLERLEERLSLDEPTHLYAEVEGYTGFALDGLPEQLWRVGGLFGELRRLGRVAIVSDQRWVRGAARLESALLPHVRYEVFRFSERERALAWVEGERALPREPALRVIETSDPDVRGFVLDGRPSAAELHAAAEYFGELGRGPIRLLGRIERFRGVDVSAVRDRDFRAMKRDVSERLERYALVGGPAWLPGWVRMVDRVAKPEVRHFDDEERAWAWLGATIVSERPIIAERAEPPPMPTHPIEA